MPHELSPDHPQIRIGRLCRQLTDRALATHNAAEACHLAVLSSRILREAEAVAGDALRANRGLQSPAVEEAVVRLCEVCDALRGARNALFEAAAAAEDFVKVATGTFYVPATGEVCGVNQLPDEVQDALIALRDAVDNLLRERGKVIAGPGVRPPNIIGEMAESLAPKEESDGH
jgi:hypothetical protein